MNLSVIVAMERNRVIGRDGSLPWHLPADLRRFRAITTGHPIVMGRRTHESIGRALPQRRNIVISRNANCAAEGCEVYASLDQALDELGSQDEIFVIGGVAMYSEALPLATRLYVTEIDADIPGDTYFPPFDKSLWREVSREPHPRDADNAYDYAFVVLERVNAARGR